MSEIRSISETSSLRLDREAKSPARRDEPTETIRRGDDRVEVSDVARLLNRLRGDEIREGLVGRVRDSIERGDYETPERIDGAIESALDDLR